MITKQDKIAIIRQRDGEDCFICKKPFVDEKPTIDHWIPRAAGGSDDVFNLRISHKRCNVLKGDTLPNADGTVTLPAKRVPYRKRRRERDLILSRFCYDCEGGRRLAEDEVCIQCGSLPGPPENPRYLKRRSPECDHNIFWCWACSIGIVEKRGATSHLLMG